MLKLFNGSKRHIAGSAGVVAIAALFAASDSSAQVQTPSARAQTAAGSLLQSVPAAAPIEQSQSIELIEQRLQNTKAMTDVEGLKLEVKNIKISGLTVIPPSELMPVVKQFIGPDKKFQDLLDAAGAIKRELARRGYFLADAIIPQQKIADGVVEILVVEGRIGKVKVEFDEDVKVNRDLINAYAYKLKADTVITARDVERALFLISDLRGINARSVFSPGEKIGTANLVIKVSKAKSVDGNFELDANGSVYTGVYRGAGTVNFNNPFGQGDMFSALYSRSLDAGIRSLDVGGQPLDTGDQDYSRLTYLAPLGRWGSKVGVAYSELHYKLGTADFSPLQASGGATVSTIMGVQPFIRSRNVNLMVMYQFDKRTFHDVQQATARVEDKVAKVYSIAVTGDLRDTLLGGGINVGNLAVTSGRVDIVQDGLRIADLGANGGLNTQGEYGKANFTYSRLQQLTKSTGLYLSYTEQWASKNLDTSEKFSLGGPNGVRAYPGGEGSGDAGFVGTVEMRFGMPRSNKLPGDMALVAFYDYAWSRQNIKPTSNNPLVQTSLRGVGVGLNWEVQNGWSMRTTAAWRITQKPTSEFIDPQPRVYFQLNKKM